MSLWTPYHILLIIVICVSPFLFLFFPSLSHRRFIGFIGTYIFGTLAFIQSLTLWHIARYISPHSLQYNGPASPCPYLYANTSSVASLVLHHITIVILSLLLYGVLVIYSQNSASSCMSFHPTTVSTLLPSYCYRHRIVSPFKALGYRSHHYNVTNTKYQEVCGMSTRHIRITRHSPQKSLAYFQ